MIITDDQIREEIENGNLAEPGDALHEGHA